MLTSNGTHFASIEFITQKKPHKVVLHDMVMFPAVMTFGDLYHVTGQLNIIIFQLGTAEYHTLCTKTTKVTRIQLYLFYLWPFWIYANLSGLTHPKRCVLYQDLISTYHRSSVPILVLSCRNEHSGLFLWLRQQTMLPVVQWRSQGATGAMPPPELL